MQYFVLCYAACEAMLHNSMVSVLQCLACPVTPCCPCLSHKLCQVKLLNVTTDRLSNRRCTKLQRLITITFADEAEQAGSSYQSWPGLFWMPPADDKPGERDMLHLDDEMAGLIEAADTPVDGRAVHSARPEASSSVPGESSLVMTVLSALCQVTLCCAMS